MGWRSFSCLFWKIEKKRVWEKKPWLCPSLGLIYHSECRFKGIQDKNSKNISCVFNKMLSSTQIPRKLHWKIYGYTPDSFFLEHSKFARGSWGSLYALSHPGAKFAPEWTHFGLLRNLLYCLHVKCGVKFHPDLISPRP